MYSRLLRLILPASFRAEAEAEMLEIFRDGLAASSALGRVGFWAKAVADVAVTAWHERGSRPDSHLDQAVGADGVQFDDRRSGAQRWSALALDMRTSLREVRRRPGQTVFQSVTLGIGIAATLLVVVLVRDVLMKPLPFADPDALVRLQEQSEEGGVFWPSFANLADWRLHATAVEGVVAASVGSVEPVLVGGVALREPIGEVTRGFFETLGVAALRGRTFSLEENSPGGPAAALIGEALWRGALGSRPLDDLALTIGSQEYRVIGVLPSGFRFLGHGNAWLEATVWLPLERTQPPGGRRSHGYHTVARLRPGVDLAEAKRSMDALAARLKAEHGEPTHAERVVVERLGDAVYGRAQTPLRLLLVASFAVLLVACLNLAAALLARGMARDRELAVRVAIGARRTDLVRLQLSQALVLAVPGAVIGAAGAWAALAAVRSVAPAAVPRLDQATLNPAAVAIALTLALGSALVAGAIPALAVSVRDVAHRIRATGSAAETRGRRRLWDTFVAMQAALTLVLLVSSAMLLRSLLAALAVDVGYDSSGVMIASVSLPEATYADPARRVAFHDEVLDRLRGAAGVSAVGLTDIPPDEVFARIGGATREDDAERTMWSGYRVVDPGFFEVLAVPVHSGELRPGVLIDRQLADGLFGGESPIGLRVRSSVGGLTMTIAGVTGPVRQWDQTVPIGSIYQDYRERPDLLLSMHVLARGDDRQRVAAAVRDAIGAVDPLVTYAVESLDARILSSMADRRLMLFIALGFAAVTLLLAATGIHALVAQSVERRRRESGIRLILGARPGQVRRRVIGHGLRSTLAGIAIGALASVGAVKAIRSQLFGIDTLDPVALPGSIVILAAAAWFAAWLPARRAGHADPASLLRGD
jgi:predicted permease